MKLFLACLLLLLVPLALSNVIAKRQEKLKVIYDRGMFLSESRGWKGFYFYTFPILDIGEDGEVFKNGTATVFISAKKDGKYGNFDARFKLDFDSDKFELDNLSFAFEIVSSLNQCDVTPAFKKLITICEGSIRVRELTGEEKSKAQERRQQLEASLEAKKNEINGASDESGEFRLLVDETEDLSMIAEAIGINNFILGKEQGEFSTHLHITNKDDTLTRNKIIDVAKEQRGSFAIENILGANKEKDCQQSPLKDWIKTCKLAELREPTDEEKSRLNEI